MTIFNISNAYLVVLLLYLGLSYTQDIDGGNYDALLKNYTDCGRNIKTDKESRFIFKTLHSRNHPGTWPWLVSMGQMSGIVFNQLN